MNGECEVNKSGKKTRRKEPRINMEYEKGFERDENHKIPWELKSKIASDECETPPHSKLTIFRQY